MRPLDTSPTAHELQLRLYRNMSAEQRSALALQLSDEVREIAEQGIRLRHPEYSAKEIRQTMIVLLYGMECARRVWPNERIRPA